MPPSERRIDRGHKSADASLRRLAEELRIARRGAGLSQRVVANAAGISEAQLSRLERARVSEASVRVFSVLFAVLGQDLSCRPFPNGSPLRDIAHIRLIGRFMTRLPATMRLRTEVPLTVPGDRRAWDGELRSAADRCKLEAETAITDVQAVERRIAQKMSDDHEDRVILLLADTRRNRQVLRESREVLRERFPLDTRDIMGAVRAGLCPPASGIVLL